MKNQSPGLLLDNFSTELPKRRRQGLDKSIMAVIIFAVFVAVQAVWQWRSGKLDNVVILLITYGAAFSFYAQRRDKLRFPENAPAQVIACVLFGGYLLKSLTLFKVDSSAYFPIFPLVGVVSCVLLVAGFYGIKQFARLLIVIFLFQGLFNPITELVEKYIPLTVISAKISAYSLWYLGFEPTQKSTFVYVNQGIVDIYSGCTAYPLFWSCIQLLIVAYAFFPVRWNKYSIPIDVSLCFIITFLLSIIRICLMALVVNNAEQFDFWHGTAGSNIFTLPSLLFCGFLILRRLPNNWDITDLSSGGQTPTPLKSSWLFNILATLFLMGLLIMVLPKAGQRTIANSVLPTDIPLAEWRWQASRPLNASELSAMANVMQAGNDDVEPITPGGLEQQQEQQDISHIPLAGQSYTYEKGLSQLKMTLVYVINTSAKAPFLGDDYVTQDKNQEEIKRMQLPDPTRHKPYLVVAENENTHLLSCITPGGNSIMDSHTFLRLNRIRDTLLNAQKMYQWLMGRRPIWDHRCLWVHLKIDGQTPESENQLVTVWQQLVDYWRVRFPPL